MAVKATATENRNDGAAHPRDEDQSCRSRVLACFAWWSTLVANLLGIVGQRIALKNMKEASTVYDILGMVIVVMSILLILRVIMDIAEGLSPRRAAEFLIIQYIVATLTAIFYIISSGIGMWEHNNNNNTNSTIN